MIAFATKLVRASDEDLNPRTVAEWSKGLPVEDVCYMLAHERHRRGLRVRMVRG